ncbi:hypothetical protein DBV05_g5399 [Lasiodiplodia theobromae]|uniref:Uncharacterized protein n=1 Tax=Lasiodiplodia theobromae TaxID=45133 RepID=A0A5N5DG01_9PEZI|nr:hypothetical protein DBV05_g5399 [Lasiodiplodia theobromae]
MPSEHAPENAANGMDFDSIDLGDGSDAPNIDLNFDGTDSKAGTGFGGDIGFNWGATSWAFSTDKKDDAAVDEATDANDIWNFEGSTKPGTGFNFGFNAAVEGKNEGDDWGWGTAMSKKDKKEKKGSFELLNKPPLPPPKPEPLATTDATADDIRALGNKQDNQKNGNAEPEPVIVLPEPEPEPVSKITPLAEAASDDEWGGWGTASSRKKKRRRRVRM